MRVLDDDALTRLLTEANPARTPVDAGIDDAAERVRRHIVFRGAPRTPAPRTHAVRLVGAAVGLAAVAAVATVFGIANPAGQAYAVTPEPLVFTDAGSTQQIIERSVEALERGDGPEEPVREVDSATWALSVDVDEQKSAVVPQVLSLVWHEDLSGRLQIVAGEAYWPGDTGSSVEITASSEVLVDLDMAAGEFNTPVVEPPGDSRAEVLAMLTAFGMPEDPDASELVSATVTALDQWTLTDAQHAVLLELLDEEDGLHVLGASEDRLGRTVYALSVRARDAGTVETVLISTDTGRIVGVETEQAVADGIVPAGAVVMYNLWQ